LKAGKWLADGDSTSRGDDTVPGDGLAAWASSHGSSGGTSAARKPNGAGQMAVSGNAAFGNALNQGVESLPGGVHLGKHTCNGLDLPDACGLGTLGDIQGLNRKGSECNRRRYRFASLIAKSRDPRPPNSDYPPPAHAAFK